VSVSGGCADQSGSSRARRANGDRDRDDLQRFCCGCHGDGRGAGYSYPPNVAFSGGGGAGAGASSVVSNGAAAQIVVTNAGFGYATAPSVVVAPPAGGYSFRSTSAYIAVADSPSFDSTTNQMTVERWFNRQTNPYDLNVLISKDAAGYTAVDYKLFSRGTSRRGNFPEASPDKRELLHLLRERTASLSGLALLCKAVRGHAASRNTPPDRGRLCRDRLGLSNVLA